MYEYTMAEPLLTVENLSVSYDKPILNNINLTLLNVTRENLSQGQIVALLGPSGIGKTQLMRCMAGLQVPNSGRVLIGTEQKPVQPGDVGVVGQHYPLFNHRTVWGNLWIAAKRSGKTEDQIKSFLEEFGLFEHRNRYPMQLSGGQRQRLAIAQQLLTRSHFLLMDEPFSGLDPIAKRVVCDNLLTISQKHEWNTTIVTTHDIASAVYIADTIWVIGRDKTGPAGASIRKQINLMDLGITWRENKEKLPAFKKLVEELETLFYEL